MTAMAAEKAGQYVCLTTLEYAVRGPLMSTHCPSCGLRLIIKHDNLVNRVTSVSLLLGMSLLIGYNLGAHGGLLHKLSNRVLRLFGFGGDDDNGANTRRHLNGSNEQVKRRAQQFNNPNNSNIHSMNGRVKTSEEIVIEELDETQMSDLTCDSAIDVRYGSALQEDDFDEQLMELFSYNDVYGDFYGKSDQADSLHETREDGDESPRKRFRTRTVDRIDQVLHQIDDIKKSIVEIDDELYHIAGSTYANFNPNFLTLTNTFADEFERDDDLFDLTPNRKISEDRTSLAKVSLEEDNQQLSEFRKNGQVHGKRKERNSMPTDARHNKESHASFSDVESLQLEWDFDFESSYDYYSGAQDDSQNEGSDRKQSPLKEKLSSAANGLDMPMTDEQKLKNMHDLLDEAKKLGLLNNIIDALAPSEQIRKEMDDEDEAPYPVKKLNKS